MGGNVLFPSCNESGELPCDYWTRLGYSRSGHQEETGVVEEEAFYGFRRSVGLRDATSSLQAFESVLALRDNPEEAKEILNTIADYNRDDCLSTWQLREWLEKLRGELETKLGQTITRPELKAGAASEGLEAELTEIGILNRVLFNDHVHS